MTTLSSLCQISQIQNYYIPTNFHNEKERLICVVCGSIARGFNFGAITCMSCKVFFRRNAYANLTDLYCRDGGNCEITQQTRKHCTCCRLLTCFRVGMKRELFRFKEDNTDFNRIKYRKNKHKKQYKLSTYSSQMIIPTINSSIIRAVDLLQWSDRSQLSNNDWLLLRQLSSTFDSLTDHVIKKSHEIYHQLSTIGIQPLKMRVKASYIYDLRNILNNTIIGFIKSIPQFILLPSLNKQAVLIRNIRLVIMFYTHYQMNIEPIKSLIQTPYWITSIECLFSTFTRHIYNKIKLLVGQISYIDPCLIKLILIILVFSTNNIDYDKLIISQQLNEYYHSYTLHKIQNIYIELMWKYMIHRFGEERTIHLFSDIMKIILQTQFLIFIMEYSRIPFEQKISENVIKSIDETLQFNKNI